MNPTTMILIFIFIIILVTGFLVYTFRTDIFSNFRNPEDQPPLPPGFEGSGNEGEDQPPSIPG